ncbi:MAG: radical SAM protein [Methanomassiliicoccaceae archaeon]|nr:radical SAM protein [Methanomassiliicoccaceae archaeon]
MVSDTFSCSPLSLDEKKRIIDHLVSCGIREITMVAMEPLFSPDAIDFFKYCRYSGVKITLTTNGTLIDDKAVSEFSKGGFIAIAISLEGFSDETNDLIRGEGSFKRTINGLSLLTDELKKNNPAVPIVVQMCVNPFNANEIVEKLGDFMKTYPMIKVSFGRIFSAGKAKKNTELILSRSEYIDFVLTILKKHPTIRNSLLIKDLTLYEKVYFNNKYDLHMYVQPSKCSAYTDYVSIMPDGKLCRCDLLLTSDVIPHNLVYLNKSVFEMPNVEIEDLTSRYGTIKTGFCLECPFSEKCDVCILFTKDRKIFPEIVESCELYYSKLVKISKKIINKDIEFKFRQELSLIKRGDCLVVLEEGKKEIEMCVNCELHFSKSSEAYYNYSDLPIGEGNILKLLLNDIIRIRCKD